MNVVDSSCWLEFIENSPIGNAVAPIIADMERLLVPTIVLYEVSRKLTAMKDANYAKGFIQGMLNADIVPLDAPLSISAANIGLKYQLERILNCCGLFEGKSPHPNPLPEGEGTLFGSPDQNGIRSSDGRQHYLCDGGTP